jgi:hypothetical protein
MEVLLQRCSYFCHAAATAVCPSPRQTPAACTVSSTVALMCAVLRAAAAAAAQAARIFPVGARVAALPKCEMTATRVRGQTHPV